MGYYTDYELDVIGTEDTIVNHAEEIESIAGYSGLFDGELKWYAHERNMREHSIKYPDLLFKLNGEGEEGSDDVWIKYFKNGKMQLAEGKITFDEFNENSLK